MEPELTPDQILDRAADHVQAGWTQHKLSDRRGNVCALGGLNVVFARNYGASASKRDEAQRVLGQYLRRRSPAALSFSMFMSRGSIIAFNDAPWRKKATVVRSLRGAARMYRRKHSTVGERINALVYSAVRWETNPVKREPMVTVPVSELQNDHWLITDAELDQLAV